MAGKKGKNKNKNKKKDKSNTQKSNSKFEEVRQKAIDRDDDDDYYDDNDFFHQESSSGKKVLDAEQQLTGELYKKLENAYKSASDLLSSMNYTSSTVQLAMMGGGSITGQGNIVANIIRNSVLYIESHRFVDGNYLVDEVPVFESLYELITSWMEALVSLAAQMYPEGTPRTELLRCVSSSKFINVGEECRDNDDHSTAAEQFDDHESVDQGFVSSHSSDRQKIDFDAFLKNKMDSLGTMNLTWKPQGGDNNNIASSSTVIPQKQKDRVLPAGKSAKLDQNDLKPLETLAEGFDEERSFQEWLKNSSAEGKDAMVSTLENVVRDLEKQLEERKKWADRKATGVVDKIKHHFVELNTLRDEQQETLGSIERMKKEMKDLVGSMIAQMLTSDVVLRNDDQILSFTEGKLEYIEDEIAFIRPDVTAAKVNEAEMQERLEKAMKKEKEELRKMEGYEKQIRNLGQQIREEKGKIIQLGQQMQTVEEARNAVKTRVQQALAEKEMANDLWLEERRSLRLAKENAQKRLATLEKELEMEEIRVNKYRFDLMKELTFLKEPELIYDGEPPSSSSAADAGEGSSGEVGSSSKDNNAAAAADDDIPMHQRCILCYTEEVRVLFLPCAHELVCFDCLGKIGDYCPHCRVKIERKIRVFGKG